MKATKSTRKARSKKTEYVSDEAFGELKEASEDALAFELGDRRDLRVTRIQVSARLKCQLKTLLPAKN